MAKENDAATDLWSQIFARAAADPMATLMDPDHDDAATEASFRAAMKGAGWSDAEVEGLLQVDRERQSKAPITSPGVNLRVEAAFGSLCDSIEAAMDRLGLESHGKVARGIEPRVGPIAAKTGVIMTDESIITVGSFLFRFCGLVARAFIRTLLLDPFRWQRGDYTPNVGRELLKSRPDLVRYWMSIFFSYAMSGTHAGVPFLPSTPREALLMEQVARAMEIFAIAHEYGHHHLAHGRDVEAEPKAQEFEADRFALRLCEEVDRRPVVLPNPYLVSGAGGLILLRALNILGELEALFGAPVVHNDTHPPVAERVARFEGVKVLVPDEYLVLKSFRTAADRIMTSVYDALVPALAGMSAKTLNDGRKLRDRMRAPLPDEHDDQALQ